VGCEPKDAVTVPFIHTIKLEGPRGEVVRVRGLFDEGALVNAMCSTVFEKVKKWLGHGIVSNRRLRMANGSVMASDACWTGYACLGDARTRVSFEVFDSGGNWAFLFGKPSLEAFKAIHDYGKDIVTIPGIAGSIVIRNEAHHPYHVRIAKSAGINLALDVKQYKPEWFDLDEGADTKATPICIVTNDNEPPIAEPGTDIATGELNVKQSLYMRHTEPFKPERVRAIVGTVTFGPNLTDEERVKAKALIAEFADCFALSVSEVTQVPNAVHRLNIPENTKFSTKVHQRPLTPPQRQFLNKKIDEMLEAGVIEHIDPSRVKCVSPTTLAQKAHEGGGLTLEELPTTHQRRVYESKHQPIF